MNRAELFATRLFRQGMLTTHADLETAFLRCVGFQAQNQRAAELNVALQTGVSHAALLAFYQKQGIARSWAQRWTIQLLTPVDLRLVVSARQQERLPKAYFLGAEDHVRAAANEIDQLLRTTEPLNRAAYTDYLAAKYSWYADRPKNFDYAVLQVLTAQGRLQMLPTASTQDWQLVTPSAVGLLDQQAATAELIRRYLRGFGPATLDDVVKWSGIKISQVRPAWQQVVPELTPVMIDTEQLWTIDPISPAKLATITDHVAQNTLIAASFSAAMTGYREKAWFVTPAIQQQLWSKNGILRAPIVAHGTVVGKWTYQLGKGQIHFSVVSWGSFDHDQLTTQFMRVAQFLAADYTGFTNTKVKLE
ncbi:winged helix DNA-binding domain-containing protein [Levilactobacillus humaensis]|uniref:winged helix DNA-binding domain-containing protein n=1 Tax=Levilactobacillus humaensis TaxID=2950375 RepID=UPI0021C36505|nr:winged helix DNA-binding domain-containing protein [Levilactobacillus humaensis]